MGEAVVFAVVGAVWLIFRRAIARRQAQIARDLTGGGEVPDGRVKGLEQLGLAFGILLLAAAGTIFDSCVRSRILIVVMSDPGMASPRFAALLGVKYHFHL